jgi:esterase/lipase superfamily enzyme
MKEFYHKWYSQYLSRDFEMNVYGEKGLPVIIFPTFNGRFFEHKDNGIIDSIADFIDDGRIKVYCHDNYNYSSWHNYEIHPADRAKSHIAYERMVINDILGFAKYETGYEKFIIAGFEFGAYHSLNFTLRHPEKVSDLLCVSGFYNIKQFIFGYYDDNCYFNNPPDYLPNLSDEWYINHLKQISIKICVTQNDPLYHENKNISNLLSSKEIPNSFDIEKNGKEGVESWKIIFRNFINSLMSPKE